MVDPLPRHELGHEAPRLVNEVGDDRASLQPGDTVVLIVENESMFARYLLDAVRERGMKGITTSLGVTALALAAEYKPSAVTLDIHLPDIAGWRVLDRLKNDPQMRHVPVAVISTDEARDRALDSGAFRVPRQAGGPTRRRSTRCSGRSGASSSAASARCSRSATIRRGSRWFTTYLGGEDIERRGRARRPRGPARCWPAGTVDCVVWGRGRMRVADADLRPLAPSDEAFDDALPVVLYGERGGEATRDGWRSLGRRTIVREAGHARGAARPVGAAPAPAACSACPRRTASCCRGCTAPTRCWRAGAR
jgi:CheY-like chemotaxis protein